MKKLMALSKHLMEFTGLPRENFHAWADAGHPEPTGRHLGFLKCECSSPAGGQCESTLSEGGGQAGLCPDCACSAAGAVKEQLEISVWPYDAVIQIERYPGDGSLLVASLMAWLQEHDAERENQAVGDPDISITLNDFQTADVDISVAFEERLVAIEDENGPLSFAGKRWSLTGPEIVAAEHFSLEKREAE